jgi:hypothetical protein
MLAMTIDAAAADRLSKLLRMLSSNQPGEIVNAARALMRTLESAGSDIHELVERLIKGGKLSDADMQRLYEAGYTDGRRAAESNQPATFEDVEPNWHQIAKECMERERFRDSREREFVEDMVKWTVYRKPSEKQGKWLHSIWMRRR